MFLKEALTFPHSNLDEIFEIYKRNFSGKFAVASENLSFQHYSFPDSPMTNVLLKKHQNTKILYEKLMVAAFVPEWLNYLLETKNINFICENVEHQLSKRPCSRTIWHFYLNYLEEEDSIVSFLES